jgi:hypothetical protein
MASNAMGMTVMALAVLAAGGLAYLLARAHRRRAQRNPRGPHGEN